MRWPDRLRARPTFPSAQRQRGLSASQLSSAHSGQVGWFAALGPGGRWPGGQDPAPSAQDRAVGPGPRRRVKRIIIFTIKTKKQARINYLHARNNYLQASTSCHQQQTTEYCYDF